MVGGQGWFGWVLVKYWIWGDGGGSEWSPPMVGQLKINNDVACFQEARQVGMAGVVRDANGSIIGVLSKCLLYFLEPSVAEALCVREVLSWIHELKLSNIVVATDALGVVNRINGEFEDNSYCGLIANDCRILLGFLDSVLVMYNHRSSNVLAHNLARGATLLPDYCVWGGPFDYYLYFDLYSAGATDK